MFDEDHKGSFSKEQFLDLMKYSPLYTKNPAEFKNNLDMCFEYLENLYGEKDITPTEFFQVLNQTSKL